MIITSKFPGVCTCCRRPINVGQKIDWVKGVGSAHVVCPVIGMNQAAPRATQLTAGVQCRTCGGTSQRGAYGKWTGTCQCCRPDCSCYDCRS